MAETRGNQPCFDPVWDTASRALILGSYPSPKSFENHFYYGHPQNRFWKLLAHLAGWETPQTITQKKQLILKNNLALWDALQSCEITGASDTSIKNPVPNDIFTLLQQSNIQAVFCNGAASHHIYTKYCMPQTGIAAVKLPSTSPANAAYTMPRLIKAWEPLLKFLPPR